MEFNLQSIVVVLAIAASAVFLIIHLVRTFSGKAKTPGCPGCQCDCLQMRSEDDDNDSCCQKSDDQSNCCGGSDDNNCCC